MSSSSLAAAIGTLPQMGGMPNACIPVSRFDRGEASRKEFPL